MIHSVDVQFTTGHIQLEKAGIGVYAGTVEVPEGAMVRYAYDRWNEEGCCAVRNVTREALFIGQHTPYRLLIVEEGMRQINDTVPQWNDLQYEFTETEVKGRVTDAETGKTSRGCRGHRRRRPRSQSA